jgi:polyhydroxyalkanoate synthesis regulator protein
MLGFIASIAGLTTLLDLGVTGVLMVMVWRLMVKKDKKSYEMIEALNRERKEMYNNMSELVKEVTVALTNKNNTDDKMSEAIKKLTDQLRNMQQTIKDNTKES